MQKQHQVTNPCVANQDTSLADVAIGARPLFAATHWTLIYALARGDTAQAGAAREEFCSMYWHAVYGYIRTKGHNKEQAEDLTQEFFYTHLLARNAFAKADPNKGRFRALLKTALSHFLINHYDREQAQKRSCGKPLVPLDAAEAKFQAIARDGQTSDMVYDREWAMAILGRTLARLRDIALNKNHPALFALLLKYLNQAPTAGEYDALAARFGMTNKAVAMQVSRLINTYHRILREELRRTVTNNEEVEAEWRYLTQVLSHWGANKK